MSRLLLVLLTFGVTAAAASPVPRTASVPPILMYHRVDPRIPGDAVGRDLTVTPQSFEAQLKTLREEHRRAISMADLAAALKTHAPIEHLVVLTFDDGYADQVAYAFPLLRKYGARATFYIVTGTIGTPGHMTWKDLRRLIAAGMDLGAHGLQHDDLSVMTAAQQQRQIFGSVRELRRSLHVPVVSYAYPSGRLNTDTLRIVRQAQVELAVTTDPRYVIRPASRFELARVRVHGDWTRDEFRQGLDAARLAGQTVGW